MTYIDIRLEKQKTQKSFSGEIRIMYLENEYQRYTYMFFFLF